MASLYLNTDKNFTLTPVYFKTITKLVSSFQQHLDSTH